MSKSVKIIGAGFSGLSLGYFLSQRGVLVKIFEKSNRVGGLIETRKNQWGLAETAATGYMNSKLFEQVMSDLGLRAAERTAEIKKRFIYRGSAKKWPLRFFESLRFSTGIGRSLLKLAGAKPSENESIGHWVERNMGSSAFEFLVGPALQGIYASQDLSAEAILSSLTRKSQFEKPHTRGTLAPEGGMQDMTDGLAKKITALGGEIHLNIESTVDNTRPVVLAVPAKTAAVLLAGSYSELAQSLARIDYLPVTTVTASFARSEPHLQGFGCLFPRSEGFQSLGVLVNSVIFANRGTSNTVLETWIFSGAQIENILEKLQHDRRKLLSLAETKILNSEIVRWPNGIPHYNHELNHFAKTHRCPPGIYLTGNYLGQIGLAKILESNYFLAEKIAAEM
jgi:protoporphyrinogen/coproporphyrinogen III oxidase